MTAVACAVTGENHTLSTQSPLGIARAITAVGQVVGRLLPGSIHQGYVRTVPASHTNIAGEKPTTVRAPFEPQVAIAVAIHVFAVQNGAHLFGTEVQDTQVSTILEEGNLLAVRTVFGLHRHLIALGQAFFCQVGGIGKLLLVLVLDGRAVNLPHTVALRRIDQAASVRTEVEVTLLFRGVGDTLGGLVVDRGDIDITMQDEGYLLVLWR